MPQSEQLSPQHCCHKSILFVVGSQKLVGVTVTCKRRLSKEVKPKQRKARQAAGPKGAVVESQPNYGAADSTDSKNNSEKRKRQIIRQLEKDKSAPLADFVINPQSFGETVENLFACKHPPCAYFCTSGVYFFTSSFALGDTFCSL